MTPKNRILHFDTPFNTFNNEIENYDILEEEASELIQAISKIKRFGAENFHPDDINKTINRDKLLKEIGDVYALISIVVDHPDIKISQNEIREAKNNKLKKLLNYYKFL